MNRTFTCSGTVFSLKTLLILLESYAAAFALLNIGSIPTENILGLVLFLFCFLFFSKVQKISGKIFCRQHAIGILFAVLYLAGAYSNLGGDFDNPLFTCFYLVMTFAGLCVLFGNVSAFFLLKLKPVSFCTQPRLLKKKTLALIFAGLLLAWLPWFLYNYPAVMTPDSLSQFSQATGLTPYSNHHPVAHTLFFQLFYSFGYGISHNVYTGIAFYTVAQMLITAAAETACLHLLARFGVRKSFLVLFFLFWALVPYHGIFAVTMWKDILFSVFLLLYGMSLFSLLMETENPKNTAAPSARNAETAGISSSENLSGKEAGRRLKFPAKQALPLKSLLLLAISGLGVCLFRSNGLYVFILMIPFVCFVFRKYLLPIAGVLLLTLALAFVWNGPVLDNLSAEKPAFTESLSIPLQQVARVIAQGRALTEEQETLLNQVCDISYVPEYYNPTLSDPIKALVSYNHPEYLEEHKGEFFRLWVELGLTYPMDYLEAFLEQTKGYWFPAAATLTTNEGISPNELGLSAQPILRGMLPAKISEILLKLPGILPLYGLLFSIGAFTWAALFFLFRCLTSGSRRFSLIFLPYLFVIATLLLATPVASDLRYAYPLILSLPLWLTAAFSQKNAGTESL